MVRIILFYKNRALSSVVIMQEISVDQYKFSQSFSHFLGLSLFNIHCCNLVSIAGDIHISFVLH